MVGPDLRGLSRNRGARLLPVLGHPVRRLSSLERVLFGERGTDAEGLDESREHEVCKEPAECDGAAQEAAELKREGLG